MNIIEVKKYMTNIKGVHLIFDSHASYDNSASNIFSKVILHKFIWKMISKSIMPYVNKVFVLAPGCKRFANDMYDISDEKMEYLYLGADTEKIDFENIGSIRTRIRKELNIADHDFVFITGGKLSKGKNIKELLLSFKEIDSNNIKLVIFGAFTNEHKEEMLDLIRQCDRVRYIGWLSGSEVYDYYLASDAAVFPGTKSALWEQAICSGLPIVCRRWPGMEYVDVGGNVIFVENNIIELGEKIELLANDKELYDEMKQVACTKGFETFSYEVIARQAISLSK
jgi:glycosyltransferase involved in cell wall biosynthesis